MPGVLTFAPSKMNLGSGTGIFTGVHGKVTAVLDIPAGYVFDGDAVLQTPLSETPVSAASTTSNGNKLIVQFDKADIDNNVPGGGDVQLTLVANLLHNGEQKQLTSTATVEVVK